MRTAVFILSGLLVPGLLLAQVPEEVAVVPVRDRADLKSAAADASSKMSMVALAAAAWAPDDSSRDELWATLVECASLLAAIESTADDPEAFQKGREKFRRLARLMARARSVASDASRRYPAEHWPAESSFDMTTVTQLFKQLERLDRYYFGRRTGSVDSSR